MTLASLSRIIDVTGKQLVLEIGNLMATISKQALTEIRWAGLTRASYVAFASPDGVWYGDRCGCFDDRCAGFHHNEGEFCNCLQSCIDQVLEGLERARLIAASPELTALEAAIAALPAVDRRWSSAEYCAASLALELALGNFVPAYSWMRAPRVLLVGGDIGMGL